MDQIALPLPFTLCFILHRDQVLLLRRRFEPWAGLLNGVGGKLEPGETPLACVMREVAEETGLMLAEQPRFAGVATWAGFPNTGVRSGMYVYLADLPGGIDPEAVARETEEGSLTWVETAAVLEGRTDAVTNIPGFLAPMLAGKSPAEYFLEYDGKTLLRQQVGPLPERLRGLVS
jgi:8-oxo-dGTP diphosphatase